VNVNETINIKSLVTRGTKQDLKLAMASRLAALRGNTPLIATFSSAISVVRHLHWELNERNSTNLWRTLGSGPGLQMHVENTGSLL